MGQLTGARVLVAEDEPLVAMTLADALRAAGCAEVRLAADVAGALRAVAGRGGAPGGPAEVDAAVLDVALRAAPGAAAPAWAWPVADALAAAGVPFAFATGHGSEILPARLAGRPVLAKPFRDAELVAAVAALLGRAPPTPGRGGGG